MEEPTMSEFPFTSTVPAPWMMMAADDPTSMAQSNEQFAQGAWEDWLNWAPQDAEQMSVPPSAQSLQGYKSAQTTMLHNGMIMPAQPLAEPMSAGSDFSSRNASSASNKSGYMFAPPTDMSTPFQFTAGGDSRPHAATHNSDESTGTPMSSERSQSVNRLQTTSPNGGAFSAPDQSLPPTATPSLEHSPGSASNGRTISDSPPSSPEAGLSANKKKRKASDDDDDDDDESGKHGPVKKTAHNMIEKRYRTNLNDKIAALRDSVPSLRQASRPAGSKVGDDNEDLEGLTPAHKLNKATVLSKATEYIRHLEKRNKRLLDEMKELKTRLENQSKAAMATPMMHGLVTGPDAFRFSDDFHATTAGHAAPQGPAQGMIPVPESMANLHRRAQNQAHYAQSIAAYAPYGNGQPRQGMAAQQPMVNGRGGNGIMNKLMVGSLAGLMIFEGFTEMQKDEKEGDRGLFAVPIGLLRHIPSVSHSGVPLLLYFKVLLLVTAFFYLVPLLNFRPKSKSKKAATPAIRLTAPPSLAVPVELRRKAWLTAIQTVWVPRHNLLLEAAALGLKTVKLSLRKGIGWHWYALLSGSSREHEDARVKAWEIALDAQLTGGDAEISVSRLVLTLMASGTLPDTPLRLMLKSLHIRVLLWEVANAGYGTWYMFEEISAKMARHYWNAARTTYKLGLADRNKADSDALPAHLAALLDIDCDDVLVQPLIQRAYNLAWNKPSAEKTDVDVSLDSVVEDFAIASPLDALAAWWSGLILNRSLVNYLAEDKSWTDDLDLAMSSAPPTSGAQVRALVAKSILTDSHRDKTVAAAFAAMPSQAHSHIRGSPLTLPINVVGNAPVSSDVMKSLTMARCLSLAELSVKHHSAEARIRATFPIDTNYISEHSLTLLSFVAAYRILVTFAADDRLLAESRAGLERLASVLRVWVGRVQGRKSGLGSKTRGVLVERCLGISMRLTGMGGLEEESDDGYVSGSESGKKLEEVETEK